LIIAVIGSRQSGKTTAIETITKGLTKRGRKVAAIKHISEEDFTMDTEQKDTWRYTQSGAQTVVSIAPHEIAIIRKVDTAKFSLNQVIGICENNYDLLILEGFRKLVEKEPTVQKIIAAKTVEEVLEASKRYKPILAFVGSLPSQATKLQIPYINPSKEPEKLVNLVDEKLEASIKGHKKMV
jgi:molybdopterin-guanine dinucleotide biosynthesis protein MobB